MGTVVTGIIGGVTIGPALGGILYDLSNSLPFIVLAILLVICLNFAITLSWLISKENNSATLQLESTSATYVKAVALLKDIHVSATLIVLLFANAAISCLEATIANFMQVRRQNEEDRNTSRR